MKIIGIHHAQITVPRGREADARAFYCDLLGLPEIPKPPVLAVRGGFWLQVGAQQVHVGMEDGIERAGTRAHVAYQVVGLAALRARLVAAGVTLIDGEPLPGMQRCELRDPFGNRVELLELATPS